MLGAVDYGNVKGSFEQVIELLGSPCIWTQAKPPHATKTVRAGFRTAGAQDAEVVNAYGIGAKIITLKAADFTVPPEKFDKLQFNAERYTADSVQPIHLNAAVVGWKIYARGQ